MCLALAAAAALGGCGEGSERDQLEDYLNQANGILERSQPEFDKAQSAYKRFSKGKLEGSAPRKLEVAEGTIRSAQRELEALEPPEVAVTLDTRLVRLFSLYADFARETSKLATYLPEAADVSLALTRANQLLDEGLQTKAEGEGQAEALDEYAKTLEELTSKLEHLSPPKVLEHASEARISGLESVRSLALRLAGALSDQDAVKVAHLLVRFRRSASEEAGEGIDRGSLRAYRRRYQRLALAEAAIKKEEAQLASKLSAPQQGQ